MNNENSIKKAFIVIIFVLLLIVSLCGCTENNSLDTNDELSKFLGTWTGNMEFSMFNYSNNSSRNNMTDFNNISSTNITELEFTLNNLNMIVSIGNETQEMSFTYIIEGNKLILSPEFDNGPLFNGQNPFDGEPPNNDTRPPFDGENPFNGEPPNNRNRPIFDGEQPSRKLSYVFNFNEELNILYLNGTPFTKS